MSGYEKTTNFLTSFLLYSIGTIIVLSAGFKTIQYTARLKFYTRYLSKWEQTLTDLSSRDTLLPTFTGNNHIIYMDQFIQHMKALGITLPDSNTHAPYIYRIPRKGFTEHEDIFLLCFEEKIVIFGLSKKTFNMLDKKIDGKIDTMQGSFTGKQQQSHADYTGIWKL